MGTKYIVSSAADFPDAVAVGEGVSRLQRSGKKIYVYKKKIFLVEVFPAFKRVTQIQILGNFLCVPSSSVWRDGFAVGGTPAVISNEGGVYVEGMKPSMALGKVATVDANTVLTLANQGILYDHPGDTWWEGTDGTVVSWWGGGNDFGTSTQVTLDLEQQLIAYPVPGWSEMPAWDNGTYPLIGAPPRSVGGSSNETAESLNGTNHGVLPAKTKYGVWKSGVLLGTTYPGVAHSIRTREVNGAKYPVLQSVMVSTGFNQTFFYGTMSLKLEAEMVRFRAVEDGVEE